MLKNRVFVKVALIIGTLSSFAAPSLMAQQVVLPGPQPPGTQINISFPDPVDPQIQPYPPGFTAPQPPPSGSFKIEIRQKIPNQPDLVATYFSCVAIGDTPPELLVPPSFGGFKQAATETDITVWVETTCPFKLPHKFTLAGHPQMTGYDGIETAYFFNGGNPGESIVIDLINGTGGNPMIATTR
jgi:hypothetical protein